MFLSWPLTEGKLAPALGLGGPVMSSPIALPGTGTVIRWQEAQSEWVGVGGHSGARPASKVILSKWLGWRG